jgi:RNA-directed DNA polymerase
LDGVSFDQIELEAWLAGLREELVSKTYRPDPVRRVMIPKTFSNFLSQLLQGNYDR